jgi:putative acetyltransferase
VAERADIQLRPYVDDDAASTLATFLSAVTVTAASDYSPEQVAAWSAPQERRLDQWNQRLAERGTIVATIDGELAGFSDVSDEGYIDMMFVDPQFGRRGVASNLLEEAEGRALAHGATTLWTDASITARPFFERHGFTVIAEQHPVTRGVSMTNYRMCKALTRPSR